MQQTQSEWVEIHIVRLMKTTPSRLYQAWLDPEQLRLWFMTSQRTNKLVRSDAVEGGHYEIIDMRNNKERRIIGTYESLVPDTEIVKTIQMPELSEDADQIEVYFEERSPGITEMTFTYRSLVRRERRLKNLEYKQKKKEYHDHTAHGLELMFDQLQNYIESEEAELE
ncbi:SRPBCC family protein [Staphylococcus canis]|uniref:SRPBCC domain-containing protein n=1 Tax=Staphylococcus canis TaxID=2724942 RepID=A0ABS0TAR7_9STAP|nr:SRPBCC domain-containing protein [Staphylococcus canis]MBI5975841.1 SRPBCC domain-containing protein [Staphylococcus canis]